MRVLTRVGVELMMNEMREVLSGRMADLDGFSLWVVGDAMSLMNTLGPLFWI
jgi:hypothetical protein